MSKMEFLDALKAEKFKKQKCKQFCWTPCIYIYHYVFPLFLTVSAGDEDPHFFFIFFFLFLGGPLLDWFRQILFYFHWSTHTWCSTHACVLSTDEAVLYTPMTVELALGVCTSYMERSLDVEIRSC